MRLWRQPTVLVNAVLALLLVGGGIWAYLIVSGPAKSSATSGTTSRSRPVPVTEGPVTLTVQASGSVQSAATAAANFVTNGVVTELLVKVGDVVAKGQTLAKVDVTAAQGQLDTAQANLTAARQSYNRAKTNNADAATIANASAQVTSAQTAVTAAQTSVNGTVLTAPIAGTVTAVNGAIGSSSGSSSSASSGNGNANAAASSSSSSSGFVALADLTKLQVSASFAEADATKLKVGQTATVTWSALSGTRATGKVATIAPTATTTNNVNSYAVVISIDTPPAGVRLGQSTTAQVTVAQADNVVRIPTQALRTAGGQRTVEVQGADGKTELRLVQVGIQGNQYVEITSGLQAGEQVVITTTTTTGTTTNNNNNNFFPGGGTGNFPGGGGNGGRGGN